MALMINRSMSDQSYGGSSPHRPSGPAKDDNQTRLSHLTLETLIQWTSGLELGT
jgi:hypothetical protein